MNRFFTKGIALIALVGALTVFSTSKAEAAFVAWICNDAACDGAGDFSAQDGGAGDGAVGTAGLINFTAPALVGGYEVVINISQSKPLLGSGMDLAYIVTNATGAATDVWLYAVDDGFAGPQSLSGLLDGNAVGGGSVTAIICGGNDNVQTPVNSGPCTTATDSAGPSYDLDLAHSATGNPYALAIGVKISGIAAGQTATGDFRVVPEPASLALLGLGLMGLAARRRRKA